MKSDSNRDAWSAKLAKWQAGLAVLAALASVAWILDMALRDPAVPFLTQVDDPTWITPYQAIHTDGIRVDQSRVPAYAFVGRFDLDASPAEARAWLRTLGDAELEVNGEPAWRSEPEGNWKQGAEIDIADALVAGRNELRVRVANPRGPALLQLRVRDGSGATLAETDARWHAFGPKGGRLETMRATDTRPDPQSFTMPDTGSVLASNALPLGLCFALGAALQLVVSRRSNGGRTLAQAPHIVLGVATFFWLALYATKTSRLPVMMGFDIVGHLEYIDHLLENHAVPLATDGWSMYHPPLGHALIAGLVGLADLTREDAAARWLYRLPTFLAGLANVWAVAFAAGRLFPARPLRRCLAVGFAALLPMNLYMSAYVSNEPMHAALVSMALCLACALLLAPGLHPGRLASLSGLLGLAILTKFTALMAVPVVAGFLGIKSWLVDRMSLARGIAVAAAVGVGAALVGGWPYLRSWRLFGHPVIGNWNLPGNLVWWEQPGFHTADYYTSFGQSLSHPFFAGYSSFWDGVYSTFWGDGLVAGMARVATRHSQWSYDFMTASYWLAFPATLLLFAGFARALRFSLRTPELGQRLATSLLLVFLYLACFALLAITFQLPYYAQAKAFYVLSAVLPLSVVAAWGLSWPLERLPDGLWPLRSVYAGWLGSLVGAIVLAFLA